MAKKQVENYRANLSEVVKEAERGSITKLARQMEIHRVTMSRKIHGIDPVSMEEAETIAAFFGYSLTDLLVSPRDFRKLLASA